MAGLVITIPGCFGMLIIGALASEMSPGTAIYTFASLISWDVLLWICGGFFLVLGGGVYILIDIRKSLPVTPATPTVPAYSPQVAPAINRPQQPAPIQYPQPLLAQPSPYELTLEQRRVILQDEVNNYVWLGYRVISQTDTTARLVRPKQFSCLLFLLSALLVIGWIYYLARYLMKRDEQIYIEVNANGRVRVQR